MAIPCYNHRHHLKATPLTGVAFFSQFRFEIQSWFIILNTQYSILNTINNKYQANDWVISFTRQVGK